MRRASYSGSRFIVTGHERLKQERRSIKLQTRLYSLSLAEQEEEQVKSFERFHTRSGKSGLLNVICRVLDSEDSEDRRQGLDDLSVKVTDFRLPSQTPRREVVKNWIDSEFTSGINKLLVRFHSVQVAIQIKKILASLGFKFTASYEIPNALLIIAH